VIGAIVGLAVAVVICAFFGQFFEAGLPISGFAVLLAIVFAISIGLVAGIYPSLRASRLTPVEALAGEAPRPPLQNIQRPQPIPGCSRSPDENTDQTYWRFQP
jgi:hypothetical protein